jgi:predicted PurR-regulated permease PerM
MTVAFLLLIAIPIGYGVSALVDFIPEMAQRTKGLSALRLPSPPEWLAGVPLVGERITIGWRDLVASGPGPLLEHVTPYLQGFGAWVLGEAGGVGMFVVQLFITILLTAVLYATGETAVHGVRRFAHRLGGERGDVVVTLAGQSIRAVALGIIVTAVVQSVLGGLGLAIAGVPYAGLLTAVMFVLCIAQLGPLPVLIAAVAWLWWNDLTMATIGLAIWTLVVGSLDNVLRPVLIRRGADLPLLLIMAGVIGGLVAFGLIGLFVGPVLLAVSYRLLQAWIDDADGAPSAPIATEPAARPPHPGASD